MRFRQFARHVLRSYGSGASAVAFAFLMTLSLVAMPVQACSCGETGDWGFIGPQDGLGSMGEAGGQFFGLHMIAVDSEGLIYTGEVDSSRVQRFAPSNTPRGRLLQQLADLPYLQVITPHNTSAW